MPTRFCKQCGQPIPENSRFCTNCGAPVPMDAPQPGPTYAQSQQTSRSTMMADRPKSYLAMAILSTIFCCLPLGIVSIVYAAKVDNYWNVGDYIHAEESSRKARGWMIAAIVTSVVVGIAYMILIATIGFGALGYEGYDFLDNLY